MYNVPNRAGRRFAQFGIGRYQQRLPLYSQSAVENVPEKRYTIADTGADYHIEDIRYDTDATRFTVVGGGERIELSTKLIGECNLSNLMAAVITARHLQVPVPSIQYGVSRIEQVEHRLNMKRTPGGISIIDDAFNSNPDGRSHGSRRTPAHDTGETHHHHTGYD